MKGSDKMKNNQTYDVVITGGGIMGSATAYCLTKTQPGIKVAVVERDPAYARASTTLSMSNVSHPGQKVFSPASPGTLPV